MVTLLDEKYQTMNAVLYRIGSSIWLASLSNSLPVTRLPLIDCQLDIKLMVLHVASLLSMQLPITTLDIHSYLLIKLHWLAGKWKLHWLLLVQ